MLRYWITWIAVSSRESLKNILADSDGDTNFGQSVAAQLSKMGKKQNALAKAKI